MCGHNHQTNNKENRKVLIISFLIITAFMIIEIAGGLLTNSLALLSDAGHMFSDSLSLLIAIIAFSFGMKQATSLKTYGFKRFEVLAALFNGLSLIAISVIIVVEAVERFKEPTEIASTGMLIVSCIGLLVNVIIMFLMIKKGDVENNINMKGAYLHVIGDTLGSIGAIIASLLIIFFDLTIADPIMSIVISIIITKSGIGIIKDALYILMEYTPKHIDIEDVKKELLKHEQITTVYDIHLWTITSNVHAFTCRIKVNNLSNEEHSILMHKIEHDLEHLGISHVTIQIDYSEKKNTKEYCELKVLESNDGHSHHE